MADISKHEFSKIRAFLWPVHRNELKKLIPLLLMIFLISFNYNILRNMKDALIVTAASSGAEVIPFLKVWAMLPMAFVLTYVFTRFSNKLSRENVFYAMMAVFLGFFFVFTFILYPARDSIHPHAFADYLQVVLPPGLKGLIAMIRYWTFTMFYVMAELWGTMILFVLFWGFVNQVTWTAEAKRFYALLGIAVNFAGIPSGQVSKWLSRVTYNPNFFLGTDAWEQTLVYLTITIITSGAICIGCFRWFNNHIVSQPGQCADHVAKGFEKPKIRMSMRETFAYLARSKYLICIAVIVVTYNVVINLVEVVWKDQVKQLYPNPGDYNAYMSNITIVTGFIATLTALFISGNAIRKFGWTFAAMISPVILLITSIGFFAFFIFPQELSSVVVMLLGTTPLAVVVFFGSAQNCLSRASKYTLFDATKEISFTPLSQESKLKGKAAIDGVGSRLGKSGGSVIHQGLLLIFTTITAGAPYVGAILLLAIIVWIFAVRALGREFNGLVASQQRLEIPDTAAEPVLAVATADHPKN